MLANVTYLNISQNTETGNMLTNLESQPLRGGHLLKFD